MARLIDVLTDEERAVKVRISVLKEEKRKLKVDIEPLKVKIRKLDGIIRDLKQEEHNLKQRLKSKKLIGAGTKKKQVYPEIFNLMLDARRR